MFQLIISILAIILAVALAGVSVYYGGSAFSNGSESAQYATLTNQAAQIEAAMTLHRAQEGADAANLAALTTAAASGSVYLKQVPVAANASAWTLGHIDNDGIADVIYVTGVGEAICAQDTVQVDIAANTSVAAKASITGVSGCTTVGGTALTDTVDAGVDAGITADAATNVFYYSL